MRDGGAIAPNIACMSIWDYALGLLFCFTIQFTHTCTIHTHALQSHTHMLTLHYHMHRHTLHYHMHRHAHTTLLHAQTHILHSHTHATHRCTHTHSYWLTRLSGGCSVCLVTLTHLLPYRWPSSTRWRSLSARFQPAREGHLILFHWSLLNSTFVSWDSQMEVL